jgi:hypothetical protein
VDALVERSSADHLIVAPMSSPQSSANPIWYVYGIVPANVPLSALPSGLDDAEVAIESLGGVAALVSLLDGAQYATDALDANSGDLEWLSPRAVAHDLVLTRASDAGNGAVVPLPMFSLFSGREAVHAMLGERATQLASTLRQVSEGREFALRVYRVDRELMDAVTSLSPRLADMAQSAALASAGQRYLLERKLAAEKKTEVRLISRQIVDEIVIDLAANALRHLCRSPAPAASEADAAARGTMVLDAAFLVASAALEEFQRTLTTLVERHDPHGFRFDFTGPWPPYHFVSEATRDA